MTLAQLVLLAEKEREMQRKAEKPQAERATMYDAAQLARAVSVPPTG